MISFENAYNSVLEHCRNFGTEKVPIKEAGGRVLAEAVYADRDFPPSDRATKDGIVISYNAVEKGRVAFEVDGVLPAGEPAAILRQENMCMEIMTGAVIPYDADTVVMYEDLDLAHGIARINKIPKKGQNIHRRGSDRRKGELVLKENASLSPADIAILASVGHSRVKVKKIPSIAVISTGDELVEVDSIPLPHQLRKSNAYQLFTALRAEGITPMLLHVSDDKDIIRQKLSYAVSEIDILLLSGGVSRGKFDYIPLVLEELGVEKIFHKVLQRPGKPFWFGKHGTSGALVFSFPGNPVSTYVCYYCYFRDWLYKSLGLPLIKIDVILEDTMVAMGDLTWLIGVKTRWEKGQMLAKEIKGNGSGDLTSLADSDGFVCLKPRETPYQRGNVVPFVPTRKLI